ncbi:MAG: VCBS repeat-containing protein [Acidobacteriota bacterium]|nr:VCBS repeat-containing protein [Acidobacteriota bacterium]
MSKRKRNQAKSTVNETVASEALKSLELNETEKRNGQAKADLMRKLKSHRWAITLVVFLSVGVLAGSLKYLEEDAKRQMAAQTAAAANHQKQSFLSSINPFLPAQPTVTSTPQLAKEYIYAGSRMLAVEDAGANAAPPADLAVWRPSSGYWYVMGTSGIIQTAQQWGNSADKAVPGDYDGDGKTDFCVFRASVGTWFVIKSSSGSANTEEYYNFGTSGDVALGADFDGDGRTDAAVYRPSNGYWYIRHSSTGNLIWQQFGLSSDMPGAADYDGDGKADVTVWRGSDKTFYSVKSSNGQLHAATLSQASGTDVPVSGDYDGDGKADFAVKSGSTWIIKQTSDGQTQAVGWQQSADKEVPNDYDGDGKTDIAVWRDSSGYWYIRNSSTGQLRLEQWGMVGDIPVPAFYRR